MKSLEKWKKLSWLFILMFVFMVITASFVSNNGNEQMPEPKGDQLWKYLTKTKPYTDWDHWPGFEDMYKGQSPHGAFLKLYVNNKAKDAIERGDKTMPENAIVVKENYNKEKKLVSITPMYKVKDYNPEAGDWFWAKYGADGKIMADGKVKSCIGCHSKKMNDDYMFTVSKK